MPEQVCIYCWRTSDQVDFSDEHIIPECVFGRLILSDHVCSECNSWLGANVDHHILKMSDILLAHKDLGYEYRYSELLKNNYKIKLVEESGDEFIATAKDSRPELLTQSLDDGRLIYPESTVNVALRKTLERAMPRQSISNDEAEAEINRICTWAEKSEPGDELDSHIFNSKYKKESHALSPCFKPIAVPEVARVVAKIAYEFIFLAGYRRLYEIKNLHKNLIAAISGDSNIKGLIIFRTKPKNEKPKPLHYIRFNNHQGFPRVEVGFFGSIVYTMFATSSPLPSDFFEAINKRFDVPKIVGIQYEADTNGDFWNIWALESDGCSKMINNSEP